MDENNFLRTKLEDIIYRAIDPYTTDPHIVVDEILTALRNRCGDEPGDGVNTPQIHPKQYPSLYLCLIGAHDAIKDLGHLLHTETHAMTATELEGVVEVCDEQRRHDDEFAAQEINAALHGVSNYCSELARQVRECEGGPECSARVRRNYDGKEE